MQTSRAGCGLSGSAARFTLPSSGCSVLTGSSGFLPGVCGVAVGYPLDTVKVRSSPGPDPQPEASAWGLGHKTLLARSSPRSPPWPSGLSVPHCSSLGLRFLLLNEAHCPCPSLPSLHGCDNQGVGSVPPPGPGDLALGLEPPFPEAHFSHRSGSRQSPSTQASGTASGILIAKSG